MDIGMGEIALILIFALLIYGGRLPEVARSLGRAIATVKRNLQESTAEVTRGIDAATSLDDTEDRPRTVRRVQPPAPETLAKEDVSAPAADPVQPEPPPTGS